MNQYDILFPRRLKMEKIKIETDELISAFTDHSYFINYYLDKKTGEIVMIAAEEELVEDEEIREKIEEEPERYIYIDPIDSSISFRIMENFIYQLPDGEARNNLDDAIHKSKPFRRFKDTLLDYPEIREKWFAYHNREMRRIAQEWLEDEEIDAELLPFPGEE
jgi:hypothetical protein